jgi:hypothetical protein
LCLIISGLIGANIEFNVNFINYRIPWKIDVVFTALVFYGLGNILKSKIYYLSYMNNKRFLYSICLLFFFSVFFGPMFNGHVNICDLKYNNILYFYISTLSGLVFYLFISIRIKSNSYLEFLGRNSLIIFTTHSFAMILIIKIVNVVLY